MAFSQGKQQAHSALHELDGSDGPTHHSKSQTRYAEEVVAHLAAARAALRQLSVSSVENLCSDPALGPVYVGCTREMAGLGCGHSAKEGAAPRSTLAGDQHQTAALIGMDNIGQNSGSNSIPGYVFTAHFFPRDTYTRCARAERPSDDALTNKMTKAMKKNPSTSHITTATRVSWTAYGDITICVAPDAIGMKELVQQIDILRMMKRARPSPSCPVPQWATYTMHGDPVSLYLLLHRIPTSWIPHGDWGPLCDLLHGIDTPPNEPSLGKINEIYKLPESFSVVGRIIQCDDRYDVLIDLYGLDRAATDTLRKACKHGIGMAVEIEWDHVECFETSFIELKD